MEFRLIANRLIKINKIDYREYQGALEMYDFLTQKNLRSTCVEILLYLRKCEDREFFVKCASGANSFSEFVQNTRIYGDKDSRLVITDILSLYIKNKVMDTEFKNIFKTLRTNASAFNAKFQKLISNGLSKAQAISLYNELRGIARLEKFTNDDGEGNVSEIYSFPDRSRLLVTVYRNQIIVDCSVL